MTDKINLNVNPLGSGRAYAGEMASPELIEEYEEEKELLGVTTGPDAAWGIDISYYNGDATNIINGAIAAGASFVIAKASDGVQLIAGSTSDEGNYIDPQFYNNVQLCYKRVPILGYHFFRHDNDYFAAPDPEAPSADMQWRIVKRWLGLPLHEAKAPRDIRGLVTDLEGYKLSDGTWSYQEDGPVVIAERLQIWMEWMRKIIDPTVDPYLTQELLYTSSGFVKSYCPQVVTQIDGGSITAGYRLWLASWLFVKKPLTSFNQVPALLPLTTWPTLGNWAEKVKFWQFGTVAIGGTEVDLNIYKGTKEQLYDWLKFSTVTPPASSPSASVSASPSHSPSTPVPSTSTPVPSNEPPVNGDFTEVVESLNNIVTELKVLNATLNRIFK